MARISSSLDQAKQAVSKVDSVKKVPKETVDYKVSNLTGMTVGKTIANEMLDDLNKLINSVKDQAAKFPQIAAVREQLDEADKQMFE